MKSPVPAKEATLQVRMDADLKEKAETLYRDMGTSFAEVVYVLKGVYKIERGEISITMIDFLEEVVVENQEVVCEALTLFSETSLDFVDCILIARHRVLGDEVFSVDRKLNKKQQEMMEHYHIKEEHTTA